jgi:DNA-binding transcriptional regulator YiaG
MRIISFLIIIANYVASLNERMKGMPNLSQAIKAEIIRISRKEIKSSVNPLRSSNFSLRKNVAELKKKIAGLEADNKRLLSINKKFGAEPKLSPEAAGKVRVTSKGIKKLREKVGLSQQEFAKLLGVTTQSVFSMEHKTGRRLRLRPKTLANLLSLRGLGKREAAKRLEEMQG